LADDQITLREATLGSDFSVDERQLKLTKTQGRLLGGSITGDAEFTNWLTPQPATAPTRNPTQRSPRAKEKEKKPEEQRASSAFASKTFPRERSRQL